MSLKRIVLGIQYDGQPWLGWQSQPHGQTVQDMLESALSTMAAQPIKVSCAGRTDAGVHALEQVVHFDTDANRPNTSWVRGVNAHLPKSIAVRWAKVLDPVSPGQQEFHSRYSARSRTYHYVLYNHPVRSPILNGRAGWVFRPLDEQRMQTAADYLLGEHDFSSFRAMYCQAKSPVKLMHEISIGRRGELLLFTFRASAFLHHMVRNIMGSLIVVGTGNQPPEWIDEVLQKKDRSIAAPTFMPDGLYLASVEYDAAWGLPQQGSALHWF